MVRRVVSIVAAVGLVSAALVLGATPADAGNGTTLTITKVVVGNPPPGTTFSVRIQCDGAVQVNIPFGDAGGQSGAVFINPASPSCSVSEPQDGNADSTTFACQAGVNVTCDTSTFEIDSGGAEVDITVTNTFVPPPPPAAEAVPAAPAFTG